MTNKIFIWIEQENGEADPIAWQTITAAEKIASELGATLNAIVLGDRITDIVDQALEAGVEKVYYAEDPTLKRYRVEPYANLLVYILKNETPSVILMGASTAGLELSAYVAALMGAGLAPDCIDVRVEEDRLVAIRPALAGNLASTVIFNETAHQFITIRRNIFKPSACNSSRDGEVMEIPAIITEDAIPTKVNSVEVSDGKISLTDASIIVSGGRGVGSPEGFQPVRELANAVGGALGASRAAVDAGWIPYSHQVGQTGKTVQPDLYIACGISGAIQHLAGMKNARVIVAINKDADVPLYEYAHYGIAGDLFSYLPAIVEELELRLGS